MVDPPSQDALQSRFLGLPIELRTLVYEQLIAQLFLLSGYDGQAKHLPSNLILLRVCRQTKL